MPIPEAILQRLETIDNLPTIRVIAAQLIEALGRKDTQITELTRLISVDPSLTSKVLRMANSSYYGLRKKVDTINLALVILGLNEVSSIVLSISLFKAIPREGTSTFDPERFWEHSAMVAHFSRLLAHSLGIVMHGEEFTGGLLHDIGKVIQVQYFPDEFEEITHLVQESGCPNYGAENVIMGVTHMELGAWLANKWKFPPHLVEAIHYHHDPLAAPENPVLAAIVFFGNQIAHWCTGEDPVDFIELTKQYQDVWDFLREDNQEEFDFDAFYQSIVEETQYIDEFLELSKNE